MSNQKKYLVTTSTENGEHHTVSMSRAEFIKRITPDKDGATYYGGDRNQIRFVNDPCMLDRPIHGLNEVWLFVIAGDVIIPKAIETVTKYEVP